MTGVEKKTPLYSIHKNSGARFTDFCGWQMPVQYTGIIEEHRAVRSAAGLFDVSHMGEIEVKGPQALDFLQYVTTNDVARLAPGRAHYSLLLNEQAGVVDDLIVYCLADKSYLLCVNACNSDKDYSWLEQHNNVGAELVNVSAQYAQIAIQGPDARQIMGRLLQDANCVSVKKFRPFSIISSQTLQKFGAEKLLIAATGYTGEDGMEVFCTPEYAPRLWQGLAEVGGEFGIVPVGLGARDTLRLEASYPLHGHEIKDDLNASYSGLGWVIKTKKGEFIGKSALADTVGDRALRLVGLEVTGRGLVRADAELFSGAEKIGWVTSGTFTPSLQKAVAMAYVPGEYSSEGTAFEADVRGRRVAVRVTPLPFYKRKKF